jgi:ADP-heptose:LPS heptosyltransferase
MVKIQIIPWSNGIGDLIRHEPLLRSIKEKYPDSHISVFCQRNQEVILKLPFVDQVFSMWCSRCDYIYNCNFSSNSAILEQILLDKGKYKELIGFNSFDINKDLINEFSKLYNWEDGNIF